MDSGEPMNIVDTADPREVPPEHDFIGQCNMEDVYHETGRGFLNDYGLPQVNSSADQ